MDLPLARPLTYLITRGDVSPENYSESSLRIVTIAGIAVDNGIDLIQIREKLLSARHLFELVASVAGITRGTNTRLLVNDRADIAAAAGADGVHLTSNSIPTSVVRRSFGERFLIGVSTHRDEEVLAANSEGADFVVFGPVFETPEKGRTQGLNSLSRVCSAAGTFPVLGLGGISELNCESVVAAGASGIAAIRALNDAASISKICGKLKR